MRKKQDIDRHLKGSRVYVFWDAGKGLDNLKMQPSIRSVWEYSIDYIFKMLTKS